MISINPPFQVLVAAGNQALAAAGINPYELLSGQVGVFDYDTNKSIDGTKIAENANVYFAVGVGATAGEPAIDIVKSAGNSIKKVGLRALAMKPYQAAVNQKYLINFGNIIPGKEYNVKFEIRNQEAYANYGYNLPSKNFPLVGGAEADPDTGLASTSELIADFIAQVNNDNEGLFVATEIAFVPQAPTLTALTTGGTLAAGTHTYKVVAVDAQGTTVGSGNQSVTTTGTTGSVSVTIIPVPGAVSYRIYRGTTPVNHSTYITTNSTSFVDTGDAGTAGTVPVANTSGIAGSVEVEILPMKRTAKATPVDLKYSNPIGTYAVLSMVDFGQDTTFAESQALVFSQTSGFDIAQKEYEAGGWNGNPGIYRNSEITGFTGAITYAVPSTNYDLFSITYDNPGIGGGQVYHSSLLTEIAVPEADDTTATAIKNVLNRLYNGAEGANTTVLNAIPAQIGETVQ